MEEMPISSSCEIHRSAHGPRARIAFFLDIRPLYRGTPSSGQFVEPVAA
jgi:hypothetical protein